MSEKLLRFVPLSELTTVRVICKHMIRVRKREGEVNEQCGAVAEVPLERLVTITSCPCCGNTLQIHGRREGGYRDLARLLTDLASDPALEIQFVLPENK